MRILPVLIGVILLATSCGKDGNGLFNSDQDPWAELRDILPGEISFDKDYLCFYDCYNDEVFCGRRQILDCDISRYHPDWFSYDCYVVTDWEENSDNDRYYYREGEEFGDVFFLVCFCGRDGNTFSNYYTIATNNYQSCNDLYTLSPRDDGYGDLWDGDCGTDWCNPCYANCAGRACGPDGCGGSCGSCPPGKTCSSAGKCISEGSDDPCSACLSACAGLPGCCTGCGCICEDVCGGCY